MATFAPRHDDTREDVALEVSRWFTPFNGHHVTGHLDEG